MKISIIAAIDQNYVISYKGIIPWNLPADLKRFKSLTLNKTVLMGRKTFESIGKHLPERRNIIITKNPDLKIPNCEVYNSCDEAIKKAQSEDKKNFEIMIIGGASIYEYFLPLASKLYLTIVLHAFKGDRFFPKWQESDWNVIEEEYFKADKNNPYDYIFKTLERR